MTPFLIVVGVLVVVLAWIASIYNSLVRLRNRVDNAWAQIEVQLKRRHDLVPNLVETVKGYAGHERQTLEAVVAARAAAVSAKGPGEQAQAENLLSGMLGKLFALSEAYPDLKANQGFLQLQGELGETENKIAISRQIYNDTTLTYNNKVQTVPSNLVASMTGFTVRPFFDAPPVADEPPTVSFG